ncbi:hypothetical protein [Paludifilum halophilum]|nr:hypothetical protein [Paludifilum halophilum]
MATAWWVTKEPDNNLLTAGKPGSLDQVSKSDYKLALQPSFTRIGTEQDRNPTLQIEALLVHGEKATGDWTFEVNGNKRSWKKEEIKKEPIRDFSVYGPSARYVHSLSNGTLKPGKTFNIRVRFRGEVDGKPVDVTAKDRVTVPGMNLRMVCKEGSRTLTSELTHAKEARGYWSLVTNPLNPPPNDEGESEFSRKSSLSTGLRHTVNIDPNSRVTVKMKGTIDGIPWEVWAGTTYEDCYPQSPVQVMQGDPAFSDPDSFRYRYTISRLRLRPALLSESGSKSGVRVTAWLKTDQPVEGSWIFSLMGKERVKEVRHTFSKKKITVELPTKTPGHYKVAVSFRGTMNGRIIREQAGGDIQMPDARRSQYP